MALLFFPEAQSPKNVRVRWGRGMPHPHFCREREPIRMMPRHAENHDGVYLQPCRDSKTRAPKLRLRLFPLRLGLMKTRRHSVDSEWELAGELVGVWKTNQLKWHVPAHVMRPRDFYNFSRRGKTSLYLLREGSARTDSELRHSECHGGVHLHREAWAPEMTTMQRLSVGKIEKQNGWARGCYGEVGQK
jgi:hypothetical protein